METVRKKIVVIDDDPAVLTVLNTKLGNHYEVLSSTQPEAAIALVRAELPDAVLCDIDMPGLNGGEVSAALQADRRTADIPFIFLTSLVSPAETRDLGGHVSGRPAISKRAPLAELMRMIGSVTSETKGAAPT